MATVQNRFLQAQQPPAYQRKRWAGCLRGLSCFGKQKGGTRIVPSSRIPEANAIPNQPNRPQLPNQNTGIALSLLAPPSSPASFSNSGLPSTAQSPTCFMSANSPGGPSSTMFVTGPYAHETQLVSPPVFSTFTTEPSTAPLTPPPELAHITTPSSPDVPYARFLSSSMKIKSNDKTDLQAAYSLYPGSPASTLRSPVSRISGDGVSTPFTERDFPLEESVYTKSDVGRFLEHRPADASNSRQGSNFFCPETFAQYYLDQSSFSNAGGRLSISRESDAYSNSGNGYQNRQNKGCKPDAEELEAYRASFGFSADEITTTNNYVEISDGLEDSFMLTPFASNRPVGEEHILTPLRKEGAEIKKRQGSSSSLHLSKGGLHRSNSVHSGRPVSYNGIPDYIISSSEQIRLFEIFYGDVPLSNMRLSRKNTLHFFYTFCPPAFSKFFDFRPCFLKKRQKERKNEIQCKIQKKERAVSKYAFFLLSMIFKWQSNAVCFSTMTKFAYTISIFSYKF